MSGIVRKRDSLFIGGQWQQPTSAANISWVNPFTEEVFGSLPAASERDVDTAVAAAQSAFASWRDTPAAERAATLHRFAETLENRAEERAQLVSQENGMAIELARFAEGVAPVQLLRYYADLVASGAADQEVRQSQPFPGVTRITRKPVGVVAAIAPWNFPAILSMFKIAPALAAGCAVVLKPSPETSLDSYVLAEASVEAGLPAGLLSVVPGDAELGRYLVSHPGVAKVAFTGSTRAGREIGKQCGELIRPVTLELGGKSAAVVLDDADVDATVQGLAAASFINCGQTCYASTRILLPSGRYDEFSEAIASMAASLPVGDPMDPSTVIGPLASDKQRERVLSYIDLGRSGGARVLTGGGTPDSQDRGFFVEPTVFGDVTPDSEIAREEIFGPVVVLLAYDGEDDAIAIANDSAYGLGGTVWSADVAHADAIADRMDSGSVGINGFSLDWNSPFGGVKDSGVGRELGPEGLAAYQQTQSVFHN
ncbi:aldehyde dehydrogenase [Gordonia sp. MP11Mi]|uniref:Geranial dehydrogenase n=1 Tax=Gordonia sp. MP11Mi TaxID=3022769 RepID=A0AA97CTI2_9ACTN